MILYKPIVVMSLMIAGLAATQDPAKRARAGRRGGAHHRPPAAPTAPRPWAQS